MKKYRECINVSIFSGNALIASIDGDRIKFDADGHVFLYRGVLIVSHFPNGTWNSAKLHNKWTVERGGEVVNHFNYWIEL